MLVERLEARNDELEASRDATRSQISQLTKTLTSAAAASAAADGAGLVLPRRKAGRRVVHATCDEPIALAALPLLGGNSCGYMCNT